MQSLLVALIDFGRQRCNRSEQLAHQVTHHQQQHRKENEEGQQTAPGAFARFLVTHVCLLGNHDSLACRSRFDQYPKGFARDRQGRQTIGQRRRKGQGYGVVIIAGRVLAIGQVLHDDPGVFIFACGLFCAGILQRHV
jgi:hypothetical protein